MKHDHSDSLLSTLSDDDLESVAGAGLLFPDIVFPSFNFGNTTTTTNPPAQDGLLTGLLKALGL